MTEERDGAVAGKTVPGCSVLEKRAVIPPSLVGTVELQVSLVFPHLKSDPLAVGVAISVIFGEECLGLLLLAVGVQPLITWSACIRQLLLGLNSSLTRGDSGRNQAKMKTTPGNIA